MIYRYDGGPTTIEYVSAANTGDSSLGNTTYSESMSFGAMGGNRRLAVAIGFQTGSITATFSVTIGGVAATIVANGINTNSPTRFISLIAIADVPSGTSGTVALTLSIGTITYAAFALHALRNLRSATPTDTGTDEGFSDGTVSLSDTISIDAKGVILASAFQRSTSSGDNVGDPTWTNATETVDQRFLNTDGLNAGHHSAIYTAVAAEGSRTITISNIRNRCSFCVAAFR